MRRMLPIVAGLLSSAAHAAEAPAQRNLWSRLWQTDDQYAQRLLRDGDAAGAAQAFDDPRHRAFAQAQAGQHADAAQGFAAFDDSDAHYNRGNALARSGDLQGALEAYETALQRDPGNTDAAHNRDLVREQLERQQQQQQQQDGASDDASEPQQQSSPNDAQAGQDGNQEQSAPRDAEQDGEQQDASQSADVTQQDPPQEAPRSEAEEREQAEHDARSALAQQQQQQRNEPPQQPPAQGRTAEETPPPDAPQQGFAEAPRSEADLAAEQWLQRIPDDPGGLLRRKFMIEHMLRQQEQQR